MNGLGLRQSMGLLHSWGGLVAGWLGFAIFLTGTLAVFDDELTRWASPELAIERPAIQPDILRTLADLDRRSPNYWFASLPADRTPAMRTMWKDGEGKMQRATVDPASGRELHGRQTDGGHFFTEFHYTLHAGTIGIWIVAAISVAMLVAIVSGVIVHRRIFSDFFTFRPRASAQRRWLDLHNLLAVTALPFFIMIVYTGVTIKSQTYLPVPNGPRPIEMVPPLATPPPHARASVDLAVIYAHAERLFGPDKIAFVSLSQKDGERRLIASRAVNDRLNLSTDTATFDRKSGQLLGTSTVTRPGYLTQRVFAGLHFGQFAGLASRWLYFVLGLAGTAMIGTGLILFAIKRNGRVTSAISVSAISGLLLACIVYLAATRWLPIGVKDRQWWEVALFFAAWFAAATHAAMMPWPRAFRVQMAVAALLTTALCLGDIGSPGAADGARWAVTAGLLLMALCAARIAYALPRWVADHRTGRVPQGSLA